MSKKKNIVNIFHYCILTAGILLSAPNITSAAQPGLDLVYNGIGAATYTVNAENPFTAIDHWVKVVDYDGIADDGSSHTVTVTYPNGGPTYNLWFYEKRDDNSAIYEFWDDTIPQPIDPITYSGTYTYRVEDPAGDWSEAEDDLQVNTLNPPDERTFSPGFSTPRSIIAHFDDVYKNGVLYDDFNAGNFDSAKWEWQPDEVTFENQEVKFEKVWYPRSESVWMWMNNPETVDELKATVRVESISSNDEFIYARIGGSYCRDDDGEVYARVGIQGNDTYISVFSEYWDGDHLIDKSLLPNTILGPVTQGNNYELTLDWDESTATFTFGVRGLDDSVNYTDTYTITGPIYPADNPSRGIGITSWVFLDTTPTFDWQAVPGANHYRVRIYNWDADDQFFEGYTITPSYTLPPGILKPNAFYKLRIYAFRDHQWFEWDNVSRNTWDSTRFGTGPNEAQDPFINLRGLGVYTWNTQPPIGPVTLFNVRVHDAQGVPDNIESAEVTIPGGQTVNLYIDEYITANEGQYRGIYFGGTPAGPYSFVATDRDGNTSVPVTEELTPEPIDYLDAASLTPAPNTLIGGTEISFDWGAVTGATNYWLAIYDKNYNRLFGVHTNETDFVMPPGILNENRLYRYRIDNYREFREDNLDNGSTSPPKGVWNANMFTTTTEAGTAPPALNLERFGAAVWHAPHPATGVSLYSLDLMAMVTDADGVPENIQRVEVIYPDGATTKELKYDNSPDWGINYYDYEYYTDPALIQTGAYTFRVTDFGGNTIELQDILTNVTANILPWPTNVAPADKTVVYTNTPTITWDAVPEAAYYKVRIMSAWRGPTVHWSGELTNTHYTVPDGILSNGATHGYRVYAYREASGTEVDFFSSNRSWHHSNYRFTIQVSDTGPVIDSFNADATSGLAPLTVEFSCAAHDPDGSIVEYRWDYDGDGTVDETTSSGLVTHTYAAPGTYPALVTVEDSEGALATSKPITITVLPKTGDTDGDGMDDSWEQQIIDDDPNDDITTIEDVLPGDDYDGDGLTNFEEFENNTISTNPDSDGDGIIDGEDNCPIIANPNQEDINTNGIGDACEGLIAYYPFNGNANDESGNGNDGTVIGPILTTDRFGNSDSAYSFDGVNDYIKASADNLPTAERTVSLWFFARSNGRFVQLGYGGGRCGTSLFMGINAWGQAILYMSSHCNANTITYNYSQPPVGDWYNFVVATDENGTKMYINGEEKASNGNFVTNTIVLNTDLSIGVDVSPSGIAPYVDGNVGYFDGIIDDIRIYNRALSGAEIQSLYNEGTGQLDSDGDGVPDSVDNCPNTPNSDQSDIDGDGIGDVCDSDACPDGYISRPNYDGDCLARPPGSVCVEYDDGYTWLVYSSITSWSVDGNIQIAYSPSVEYRHVLDSSCVQLVGDDTDSDLVPDLYDNCSADANPLQEDLDADGTGDVCDSCPDDVNTEQSDSDGDLIGDVCDADDDNDFALDEADNCPLTYNPGQENLDGDGLGDACDADADDDGYDSYEYGGDDCDDTDAGVNPGAANCLEGSAAPEGGPNATDTDEDGVRDSRDNCSNVSNAGQADADRDRVGDACDNCAGDDNADQADYDGDGIGDVCDDSDGDGSVDAVDNCREVANDQSDSDGDGIGNACDPDTDADDDGHLSQASGGDDCDDGDPAVYPGATELSDGKDNDCDGTIDEGSNSYYIRFEMANYDSWLPNVIGQIPEKVTVTVIDSSSGTPVAPDSAVTYTVTNVSNHSGQFTNDADSSAADDFSFQERNDVLTLTTNDFSGSITIHAEASVSGYLTQGDFILPKDSDGDGLPDAWEIQLYGNLSTLTAASDDPDGDGLTNAQEFSGFKWGPPLVEVAAANSGGLYQTTAFMPQGNTGHFRTHPDRMDLFVRVDNYDFNIDIISGAIIDADTGYNAPCDCPFALGTAFLASGVDVHAVSLDNLPNFMGAGTTAWQSHIDVVTITNNLSGTYSTSDGHINKRGLRDWGWDTKGFSGIGDAINYGGGTTTYQIPLDNYFAEYPYSDDNMLGGSPAMLDAVDSVFVEDQNDNGTDDKVKGKKESEAQTPTSSFDGDRLMLPIGYGYNHSALDVDHDGKVELPVVNDPSAAASGSYADEYTVEQVLKHTITHELGHAVGMSHNACSDCLMYEYSTNWRRDDSFSADEQSEMHIHNN